MHDQSYEGFECDICKKVLHTKGRYVSYLLTAIGHIDCAEFNIKWCLYKPFTVDWNRVVVGVAMGSTIVPVMNMLRFCVTSLYVCVFSASPDTRWWPTPITGHLRVISATKPSKQRKISRWSTKLFYLLLFYTLDNIFTFIIFSLLYQVCDLSSFTCLREMHFLNHGPGHDYFTKWSNCSHLKCLCIRSQWFSSTRHMKCIFI